MAYNFETLTTDRLLLKKLTPKDYCNLFENYSKEEIKFILGHASDEEFEKEKYKFENGYSTYNRSFLYFQIIDKTSMQIIGGCGFHNWASEHRRAELGYSLTNKSFKRKGIMSEVLPVILDYGFNQMNLHRIEAIVGPDNIPSLRLIEKFHFQKEGVLREHYSVDNLLEDSIIFSRLVTDFKNQN